MNNFDERKKVYIERKEVYAIAAKRITDHQDDCDKDKNLFEDREETEYGATETELHMVTTVYFVSFSAMSIINPVNGAKLRGNRSLVKWTEIPEKARTFETIEEANAFRDELLFQKPDLNKHQFTCDSPYVVKFLISEF